jgi:hypothetical protein
MGYFGGVVCVEIGLQEIWIQFEERAWTVCREFHEALEVTADVPRGHAFDQHCSSSKIR